MSDLLLPQRRLRPTAPYLLAAAPVVALAIVALLLAGGGSGHGHAAAHAARAIAEAPDPLASQSYAQSPRSVHHARALSPRSVGRAARRESFLSPGAPSDQQVLSELSQEQAVQRQESKTSLSVTVAPGSGMAIAPADLPLQIQEVIAGGNAIRDFPYVYGGGHRSFIDNAYDCSGSVSYALAAGGLIKSTETSGQLERWGVPGPGRYLTVFATVGHTFMYVDGVWFDTAGRAGPYTTRWLTKTPSLAGYVERHYPGL
jgi:hypothetical protein